MKTYFPALLVLLGIAISSCTKEISCFGTDCVYPEATVAIDSIINQQVYVTLFNKEGNSFAYPLKLSPSVDYAEFIIYSGIKGSKPTELKSDNHILKVSYVAVDQSYVLNNASYINAFETELEIVAFGQDLILTY